MPGNILFPLKPHTETIQGLITDARSNVNGYIATVFVYLSFAGPADCVYEYPGKITYSRPVKKDPTSYIDRDSHTSVTTHLPLKLPVYMYPIGE